MYMYIILLGWILGISFMGAQIPQYLSLYLALTFGLSFILWVFRYFKFSSTNKPIFKYFSLIMIGEFRHEVRQFQKPDDKQQAEQISIMV